MGQKLFRLFTRKNIEQAESEGMSIPDRLKTHTSFLLIRIILSPLIFGFAYFLLYLLATLLSEKTPFREAVRLAAYDAFWMVLYVVVGFGLLGLLVWFWFGYVKGQKKSSD